MFWAGLLLRVVDCVVEHCDFGVGVSVWGFAVVGFCAFVWGLLVF